MEDLLLPWVFIQKPYIAFENFDNPEYYTVHSISDFVFEVSSSLIAKINEF